jgi:hypothetical protein
MDDPNQIEVPPTFLALYTSAATRRLTRPIAEVRDRYELCEDLSQMLTEHPSMQQGDDAASRRAVLAKTQLALQGEGSPVEPAEATWVIHRLAELLGWEQPEPPAVA